MLNNFRFRNAYESMASIYKFSIILCWLMWAASYSLTASINIPTFHLDGAFQTASGLYRLDAGQFPGKDFYPYLGIGPLFMLYPFFKAFGANISASVFSAQLVVLLIGVLSTAFIWYLIWRPKSFITSVVVGCFLFLAPIGVASYFSLPLPDWMTFSISPGNSLRPFRAAAPYLVAIIYYFLIFHISTTRNKYAVSGLLTGSILLWSNDFAIPSAGLLAFFIFVNSFFRNEFQMNGPAVSHGVSNPNPVKSFVTSGGELTLKRLRNVFVFFATTIFSWAILLALSTHGHPIEMLKYNFITVAHDQWWFFGPYRESTRIFNIQQLTRLFSKENYVPTFVFILIAFLALKTKRFEHALLLWIGAVLFSGGVIASIGGHLGGYFGGFYFWGMMASCAGFSRLVWLGFRKISVNKSQLTTHKSLFTIVMALIFFGVSLLLTITSVNNLRSGFSAAKNDPNRFYVPELGGYLGKEWKDYIDLAKQTKETRVFEEYWGLWSATRKTFPSWPVDSVIHALGNIRGAATKDLQGAGLIISTRYSTSPIWQPWLLSQNYWFYENLLRDWEPSTLSPTTIVWRKSKSSRLFKDVDCAVGNNESRSLILQAQEPGFYEIEMQYSFSGIGRFLIMVKNNLSFGGDARGYVSIDPALMQAKFPAFIKRAGVAKLNSIVIGKNHFKFEIQSCTAKYIPAIDEVLRMDRTMDDFVLTDNFFLTDSNWSHGVARRWAGFFVPNDDKFYDQYIVGRNVRFADGKSREIVGISQNGQYLNIFLDGGDPLDPEKVGLPSKFVVMDDEGRDLIQSNNK